MASAVSYQASCTVCYDAPMKVPIIQCHNGHLLCCDCELKVTTCPTCMEPLDKVKKIRNRAVENMQPPMLVCKNQSSGCSAGFFMDDELEKHHAECRVSSTNPPPSSNNINPATLSVGNLLINFGANLARRVNWNLNERARIESSSDDDSEIDDYYQIAGNVSPVHNGSIDEGSNSSESEQEIHDVSPSVSPSPHNSENEYVEHQMSTEEGEENDGEGSESDVLSLSGTPSVSSHSGSASPDAASQSGSASGSGEEDEVPITDDDLDDNDDYLHGFSDGSVEAEEQEVFMLPDYGDNFDGTIEVSDGEVTYDNDSALHEGYLYDEGDYDGSDSDY